MPPTVHDTSPADPTAGRQPHAAVGDEIDLLAYAATLWRYRYLLAAVAVIVGGTAYAINRAIAPTYEVTFRLMVSQPRLDNEPFREINIVPFRELVESPMLAAALLDEFGLRQPPYRLTPQRFLASHVSIDVIRDSTIIRVAVRLKDPQLAVKLGQRYAERVVELAERLNVEGVDYTTDRIKLERDAALQRLTNSERALDEYRRRVQIEIVRNDVDSMLLRRPEALDLTVEIQGERARVQQTEAELARQDKVREVARSLDALPTDTEDTSTMRRPLPSSRTPRAGRTPDLPEARQPDQSTPERTQKPMGTKPADPQEQEDRLRRLEQQQRLAQQQRLEEQQRLEGQRRLEQQIDGPRSNLAVRGDLLNPYINPVYEALERDLAVGRSRLAALEQRRRELVRSLQLDAPSAEKLNHLYEAETGLEKLTRENDVAREAYLAAATKYEEARLQSTVRATRIQILDAALPPDRPVAPRALRNTLTAILIALTIAAIAVLVRDSSRPVAA